MSRRVYQTKKCPFCGSVYETRTESGYHAEEEFYKFGPLFVTCRKCGKAFRDSSAYELAVMDPPKDYLIKVHASSIISSLFFIFLGIVSLLGDKFNSIVFPVVCFAVAGLSIIADYSRYRSHVKTVARARDDSILRLKKNPKYALLLKEAGFSVPDEYLPKDS